MSLIKKNSHFIVFGLLMVTLFFVGLNFLSVPAYSRYVLCGVGLCACACSGVGCECLSQPGVGCCCGCAVGTTDICEMNGTGGYGPT